MGLMDRVKAQANSLAQQANAGLTKLEPVNRKSDTLLRSLAVAVLADRTGRGNDDTQAEIDRLITELKQHEAQHNVDIVRQTADTEQAAADAKARVQEAQLQSQMQQPGAGYGAPGGSGGPGGPGAPGAAWCAWWVRRAWWAWWWSAALRWAAAIRGAAAVWSAAVSRRAAALRCAASSWRAAAYGAPQPYGVQPPGGPQPYGAPQPAGGPQDYGMSQPSGGPQAFGGSEPSGRPQAFGGSEPSGGPQPYGVQPDFRAWSRSWRDPGQGSAVRAQASAMGSAFGPGAGYGGFQCAGRCRLGWSSRIRRLNGSPSPGDQPGLAVGGPGSDWSAGPAFSPKAPGGAAPDSVAEPPPSAASGSEPSNTPEPDDPNSDHGHS